MSCYYILEILFRYLLFFVSDIPQIHTMEMVRRRFYTLPKAFNASLVPFPTAKEKNRMLKILSCSRTQVCE
jgi:hypothetical protein